jgi:hypothetical protein
MICTDGSVMRTERHRGRHTEHYVGTMCTGFGSGTAYNMVATFACRQVGREAALAMVRAYCGRRLRLARQEGW